MLPRKLLGTLKCGTENCERRPAAVPGRVSRVRRLMMKRFTRIGGWRARRSAVRGSELRRGTCQARHDRGDVCCGLVRGQWADGDWCVARRTGGLISATMPMTAMTSSALYVEQ